MSLEPPTLYCTYHPDTPTTLRCSRCEKPICSKDAVRTPTGYRCRDCVRGQQKTFDTTRWFDYPLTIVLAAGLSYAGSRLVPSLGFFTIFVAPIAGVVIAEIIRLVIQKRRSRLLFKLIAGAAAAGGLITIASFLILIFMALSSSGGTVGIGFIFPLIWQGVYTFLVTSTVYYRLGGIQI
jgi:hypothetical protein